MEIEIIFQLILATFSGALIGLEREIKGKEAGLRTFSLVTLGSCLFTLVSLPFPGFNPAILAIGIGFLGAGVISQQSSGIVGLTTAAALWMCRHRSSNRIKILFIGNIFYAFGSFNFGWFWHF